MGHDLLGWRFLVHDCGFSHLGLWFYNVSCCHRLIVWLNDAFFNYVWDSVVCMGDAGRRVRGFSGI